MSSQRTAEGCGPEYRQYSLGCARIPLQALRFPQRIVVPEGSIQLRPRDPNNVTRLEGIFALQRLNREEERHFVKAIAPRALSQAYEQRLPQVGSFPLPFLAGLGTEIQVDCLHGRHRIEAAKQYLEAADQWWPVELFSEGRLRANAVRRGFSLVRLRNAPIS